MNKLGEMGVSQEGSLLQFVVHVVDNLSEKGRRDRGGS